MAGHSHLIEFPEALEAFLSRTDELAVALGPRGAAGLPAVQALVAEGLAARDRGDARTAMSRIAEAMTRLAGLASDSGSPEAPMLRAMAERFREAVVRGDVAQAKGTAEVMRERSGSRVIPKKDR